MKSSVAVVRRDPKGFIRAHLMDFSLYNHGDKTPLFDFLIDPYSSNERSGVYVQRISAQ